MEIVGVVSIMMIYVRRVLGGMCWWSIGVFGGMLVEKILMNKQLNLT